MDYLRCSRIHRRASELIDSSDSKAIRLNALRSSSLKYTITGATFFAPASSAGARNVSAAEGADAVFARFVIEAFAFAAD